MAIGLVIDAVTYARDYSTDAAMKAETSNGLVPGELAFSAESGIYSFETALYQPLANDLKLDNNKGYWRKLSDPYIALEANSQISDLNIPGGPTLNLDNGKIFVGNASNQAVGVTVSGDATLSSAGVLDLGPGVVANEHVNAAAAIAFSKLAALPSGQVLVGNGSNVPTAVALSGDVTVNSSGVASIAAGSIVDADISASAAIAFTKLAPLSSAQFMVGNASNQAAGVALSGDVSASNTGVVTIAPNAVVQTKLDQTMLRASMVRYIGSKANKVVMTANTHPNAAILSGYIKLLEVPDTGATMTFQLRNSRGNVLCSDQLTFTQGVDGVNSVKEFTMIVSGNLNQITKGDSVTVEVGGTTVTAGKAELVIDFSGAGNPV